MQVYNGAFNNTTSPIAVGAQAQFMQNCGPPPNKKKKAVDGHAAEETTATSSSEE